MKKLSEKEQEKVSGGYYHSSVSKEEIERHKGSPVGKYDAIDGNVYFFESTHDQIIGKLLKTYENSEYYGTTKQQRTVQIMDIRIIHGSGYEVGSTVDLNGDAYELYEYID